MRENVWSLSFTEDFVILPFQVEVVLGGRKRSSLMLFWAGNLGPHARLL